MNSHSRIFETNRMHRGEPGESLELNPETPEHVGYSIAYIEFDDQGDLWDASQLFRLLDHIREKNTLTQSGIYCTVFVHGWKNNASRANELEEDGILRLFKKRTRAIAEAIKAGDSHWGETLPHVLGVYLGWRGMSFNLPILRDATFWARKLAASRVAGDAFTLVISELMYAVKENPRSKCTLLGHSFGGLILEKAIIHTLIAWISMSKERYLTLPWDFLGFINPASSALGAYRLMYFFRCIDAKTGLRDEKGAVREIDSPVLVSVTSEMDYATKYLFPLGQFWSCLLTSFRRYKDSRPSQWNQVMRTTGHMQNLFSHTVKQTEAEILVEPISDAVNKTPFWIMQVPRSMSAGHSDVFDNDLYALMEYFLERNEVFNPHSQIVLITSQFDDRNQQDARNNADGLS